MNEEIEKYEELQKKEHDEVEKMSEEMKKAFYEFKEGFKTTFIKDIQKKKAQSGISDEDIETLLLELDYIELFYSGIKQNEVEKCLKIIYENCMVLQNVHDMAYDLNSEYKILWDNFDENAKKDIIKARKMLNFSNNLHKAKWGFATAGLSVLGSKALKGRQDNKIKEYVTGEGFTNLCIIVNTNSNNYEKGAN